MVVTTRTILDELKLAINDLDNKWRTDAEYRGFILKHLTSSENTYTLTRRVVGDYTYVLGGSEFWYYGASFTADSVTGTCTGTTSTTILKDTAATFITDGIEAGQTVTLDVGGETAVIAAVDSETQLTTAALSGTGTYDTGEAYTIEPDYTQYPNGSIHVDLGVDTRMSIDVTAITVNFPEVVVAVCMYLKTHKAQLESVNISSAGFTPMDEDRLTRIQEHWRGVVVIQ